MKTRFNIFVLITVLCIMGGQNLMAQSKDAVQGKVLSDAKGQVINLQDVFSNIITQGKTSVRSAPANDAAENATVITPASITCTITQDASGATNNDGPIMYSDYENGPSGGGMDDGVWYKFDPKITGDYTISVDADWDVEIAVLFGLDDDVVPDSYKANVDDLNSGGTETITVKLYNDNACYWINIGDADWSLDKPEGEFTLRIEGPAVNDAAENATEIEHGYFPKTITQDASGATNNDGFILFGNYIFGINGLGMNDGVWYKFTPKVKGNYIISVNADWDAEIGIFYRTDPGLTPNKYKTHIDGNVSGLETDTMMLFTGNTYWLNIGCASYAEDNPEGEFTLEIEGPDINDNKEYPQEVKFTSNVYSTYQTSKGADDELFIIYKDLKNCPSSFDDTYGMNDGVWYKIPAMGFMANYTINVDPSGWDAEVVMMFENSGGEWCYKKYADGWGEGGEEEFEVTLNGNFEYYICIGGFSHNEQQEEGYFDLEITVAPPPNNVCSSPILMSDDDDSELPWMYTQKSAVGATGAPFKYDTLAGGSGVSGGMNDGVWYQFDPEEESGEYTIQVIPYGWDAEIGIFNGYCDNLTYKTHGDNGGSGKMDEAVLSDPNTFYYHICVGNFSYSYDSGEGPFTLYASLRSENDNYQNAIRIPTSSLPYSNTQDAQGATNIQQDGTYKYVKYSDYEGPAGGMNDGVWYKFTPPYVGDYKITVSDDVSEYWDSEISVFWGDYEGISSNGYKAHEDSGYEGDGESITVRMYPASTYYINVGAPKLDENEREGEFTINVEFVAMGVAGIEVSPTESTLEIGGTVSLVATVTPDDAVNKDVTWSSSNESVATVDANGVVTAVAGGTADITVTSVDNDSKSATCEITVTQPVTGVTLTPTEAQLFIDSTKTLTATVEPSDATNTDVTWTSDDAAIVTVDASGKITAVAEGTANIIVKTDDGDFKDTCVVTVVSGAVTGVTVTPASTGILVDGTVTLNATVLPSYAFNKDVTWSSANDDIATVDDNGKVTAVAEGVVDITVKTDDGDYTATCVVTVTGEPVVVTGVSVTPDSVGIPVGKNTTLTATVQPTDATNTDVTWTSDDEAIATVEASGKVTAVAEGTVNIIVKTVEGNFTDTCVVTVTTGDIAVTGVTVDPKEETIEISKTKQIIATITPAEATNKVVTWTTSDAQIATVNASGVVTGVKEGVVDIVVKTDDGNFTDTCVVTVGPDGILEFAENITLYPNPVKDVLRVSVDENFDVEIYNAIGNLMLRDKNNGINDRQISVSDLPKGIYLVKIITEKGVYSRKIVKE